jgi:hypothetical protein
MNKYFRLSLAILILTLSMSLLIWAYAPNPRETRIQQIAPTEMQIPAP